jgi:diguanylate cyclase (GGDEF)-like protein
LEDKLYDVSKRKMELEDQVVRDPLTQIYNRRYLDATLPRELSRAKREAYPVAIIMLDLDHFKRVNDSFSHAAGDHVLKSFTALLSQGARDSDMVCRYGGEEFVVIMPGLNAERALERVEAWRAEQQATTLSYGEHEINITVSAGIAVFPEHGDSAELLLERADAMLYRSKNGGRNRISVYGD